MQGAATRHFVLLAILITSLPVHAQDRQPRVGPSFSQLAGSPVLVPSETGFVVMPSRKDPVCTPSTVEARAAWEKCSGTNAKRIFEGCTALIESKDSDAVCLATAHFNRGTAHAKAGDYERAVDDFSEAITLDWYYSAAYTNRGLALDALGMRDAALKDYAIAQAMPANSDLQKAAQSKASERRQSARSVTADDFVMQASGGREVRMMPMARPAPVKPEKPEKQAFEVVKLFYATDRKKTGSNQPNETFGSGRDGLSFGVCEVSIPSSHVEGQLEDVGLLEWREDPENHILLQAVTGLGRAEFFKQLQARTATSTGKGAFLFVHGFNTSFRDAARRTAQLYKDLKFDGAPVFYSWPSQASPLSYVMDATNAEWSVETLKGFLKDFAKSSGAERIFLIAHSMGTQLLTNAMAELLSEDRVLGAKFTAIVLAAPDIDADVFKRDLAPRLLSGGTNIVLYSSNSDQALWTSRQLHGYLRAGDSAEGVLIVDGIDTIDAAGIDTSLLGHSYFAGTRAVLADIGSVIATGHRADQRKGLKLLKGGLGKYWQFASDPAQP
jgi:esterase/lipase superfamily enzyme